MRDYCVGFTPVQAYGYADICLPLSQRTSDNNVELEENTNDLLSGFTCNFSLPRIEIIGDATPEQEANLRQGVCETLAEIPADLYYGIDPIRFASNMIPGAFFTWEYGETTDMLINLPIALNNSPSQYLEWWRSSLTHETGHHIQWQRCVDSNVDEFAQSGREAEPVVFNRCLDEQSEHMRLEKVMWYGFRNSLSNDREDFLCAPRVPVCNAMNNSTEDFADSFKYYMYHPAYFRLAATHNEAIAQRYEVLRGDYFDGVEFSREWDALDEAVYYVETGEQITGLELFLKFQDQHPDYRYAGAVILNIQRTFSAYIDLMGKSYEEQIEIFNETLDHFRGDARFERYAPYLLSGLAELYSRTSNEAGQRRCFEQMLAEYCYLLGDETVAYGNIFPTALSYLGDFYFYGGESEQAQEYYELFLQYYPTAAGANDARANLEQLTTTSSSPRLPAGRQGFL